MSHHLEHQNARTEGPRPFLLPPLALPVKVASKTCTSPQASAAGPLSYNSRWDLFCKHKETEAQSGEVIFPEPNSEAKIPTWASLPPSWIFLTRISALQGSGISRAPPRGYFRHIMVKFSPWWASNTKNLVQGLLLPWQCPLRPLPPGTSVSACDAGDPSA